MNKEPFLKRVVSYYYDLYKEGITDYCFIFPSKRSQMFFQQYLQEQALRPIFAPKLKTINDFICSQCSDLKVLDETALLFELYKSYVELRKELNTQLKESEQREPNSFDEFLFWGRLIIKDFDQLDRHLVDSRSLLINLKDYKELTDDYSYLEEDTLKLIQDFWKGFEPHRGDRFGEGVERFMHFWEELPLLYQKFNDSLFQKKATYEGAIYRYVADNASECADNLSKRANSKKYIFVGLFALTKAERKFLKELRLNDLAEFVWNEDVELLKDRSNPVTKLLARDIEELGQVKKFELNEEETFLPEEVHVLRTVSAISQAKALPNILAELKANEDDVSLNKAVILPQENLLLPVVASIPDTYSKLNISMGYPLAGTSVSILISKWKELLLISRDGSYYPADKLSSLFGSQLLSEFVPELQTLIKVIYSEINFYYTKDDLFVYAIKDYSSLLDRNLCVLANKLIDEEPTDIELYRYKELYKLNDLSNQEFLVQILRWTIVFVLLEPKKEARIFLDDLVLLLKSIYTLSTSQVEPKDEPVETLFKLNSFDEEFIFHYIKLAKRLLSMMEDYKDNISFSLKSCISLLERLVYNIKIPFEGNPLEGLQILGFLESRVLSFDYLVYLSVNESILPRSSHQSSLIPYVLQQGFAMPSSEDHDAVSTYHFYQTIAQCKKLILFCAEDDALGGKGEESRYIKQLRYHYCLPLVERTVEAVPHREEIIQETVDKKTVEGQLNNFLSGDNSLSISRLLVYARCPLEFYYETIEGVKPDELPDALNSPRVFGDILHHTMELIYKDYIGMEVPKARLLGLIENEAYIRKLVLNSEYYTRRNKHKDSYWQNLEVDSIVKNIVALLRYDYHSKPFIYLGSEIPLSFSLPIYDGAKTIHFYGLIDRCDLVIDDDGMQRIRILDYKTGGDELKPINTNEFEDFYERVLREKEGKKKAIIQTLFYCLMVLRGNILPTKKLKNGQEEDVEEALSRYKNSIEQGKIKLSAGLLLTREISKLDFSFSPDVIVKEGKNEEISYFSSSIEERLTEALTKLLEELFNLEEPFAVRGDGASCKYCLHN